MTAGDDGMFVTVGGKDIGLEALMKRIDAEMKNSADQAARLGQQYARLAQAQGQPATAANILAGTMQRAGSASERSLIGIATQQANLANNSRNLTQTISGLGGQLSQLGGTAGQLAGSFGQLAGSFGTLGTVGAAIGLGKVAVDLSVAGANASLVRDRFDGLAEAANTTGDALLGALRAASGGEIADLNLELAANRANMLGVADSAEEMSVLLAIARDRAQQLGTSSTKAFDDLVTGLGRGSPLILDNLGIIVSVKEANDQYAASIGKTASALSEAEQKQALINAVLAQGRASLESTGGAVESTAGSFQRLGASAENAKNKIGELLAVRFEPIAEGATRVTDAIAGTTSAYEGLLGVNQTLASFGDATFNPILGALGAYNNAVLGAGKSTLEWLGILGTTAEAAADAAGLAAFDAALQRTGDTTQAETAYQAAYAESLRQSAAAAAAATGPHAALSGAFDAERSALGAAQVAAQQHTAETQANAQAAVLAAAQQQAQKAATDAMTAATTQAVSAFLALNPTIDAAGIASAVTAGKIPPLIGQLAQLRVEAYSARDAIAALAAQQGLNVKSNIGPGGVGINAPGVVSGRNNSVDAVVALQAANKKAADDAVAGDLAIARAKNDTAKQVSLLRQQQAGLNKSSLEYKQIEAQIIGVQSSKRGGGGGGGGTRLTDQQKLQNSLLTSQEDYQQKSEDAATQHAIDVEKIYQDYYAKLREAQRDFDQSQLEGRAGFYDNLGQIESQKIQQQASAAYEAASIEAGRIAQEKGADVAEKYMDAQEQIISNRAKRLAEIEKAEKDKDAGRAEYLRGVDAQYKAAEDAKLARIQEGEGSLASERDKQLSDAAAKEADAQDKIGLAYERTTDRKVTANERANKLIDTEALKVDGLIGKYDALGVAASRAGITPTAPSSSLPASPPATSPGTASAAAPTDLAAALAQLNAGITQLNAGIAAVERAVNSSGDKVAGALRVRIAS